MIRPNSFTLAAAFMALVLGGIYGWLTGLRASRNTAPKDAFAMIGTERAMKHFFVAIPLAIALAGTATARGLHPTTKEGFGAKPDSPETQREGKPESPATRPEAQGGANSQQNRSYGNETQPEGNQLNDGQPAAPKP